MAIASLPRWLRNIVGELSMYKYPFLRAAREFGEVRHQKVQMPAHKALVMHPHISRCNWKTSLLGELVVGTPVISATYDQLQKSVNRYLPGPSTQCQYSTTTSKQMKLRPNISETVKSKLSLGARILRVGGVEKVFKQFFSVGEGERLLKASHCYLSTSSGPLAGLLFISTDKVAFCSERSMKVFTQKGHMLRIHYKVVIPLKNIKCVNQSENVKKPTQKYIEIVTVDNFDFWFMGVFKYQKTFKYLEQATSLLPDLVVGTSIISATFDQLQKSVNKYLHDPATQCHYSTTTSKQMKLEANISETVKRKLSLGTHMLQVGGGVEKVFKHFFSLSEGERLLKASQCYLSTTSGPLAGLLFISTEKVAFCSEKPMKVFSQEGHMLRIHYKVVIPLKKIECVNQSKNVQKPKQKYIHIVTVDNFDFWFMGVLKYQKILKYLEQATSLLHDLVVGTPVISATYYQPQKSVNRYLPGPATQCQYSTTTSKQMNLGTKISETVKGKLNLGARILRVGGVEKVFKQFFSVGEGERLLKTTQCYLSTTSGPLAGFLFISTDKVAFCSERSMKVFTQKGHMLRIRYKVVIPLKKIKCVNQSENVEKPRQKYIEIVTEDNFDFWFMGVFKYQKTFKYLQQAVSQA
ncbi:GEM-like protein 4, partial [Mucuna pruriens]